MGIFFYIKSVALVEDVGVAEIAFGEHWEAEVDTAYKARAYNCWIAVAMYVGSFGFSLFQLYLNKRASHQA
jgi:hypothetical protein